MKDFKPSISYPILDLQYVGVIWWTVWIFTARIFHRYEQPSEFFKEANPAIILTIIYKESNQGQDSGELLKSQQIFHMPRSSRSPDNTTSHNWREVSHLIHSHLKYKLSKNRRTSMQFGRDMGKLVWNYGRTPPKNAKFILTISTPFYCHFSEQILLFKQCFWAQLLYTTPQHPLHVTHH